MGDENGTDRPADPPRDGGAVERTDQGDTGAQADLAAENTELRAELAALQSRITAHALPPGTYLPHYMTATSFLSGGFGPGLPCPQEPIKHEGIVAGEIVAWRCWKINDRTELTSMFTTVIWLPDIPMTGDVDSGLGVHAWKTHDQALSYGNEGHLDRYPIACGTVKLWGEVVEHTDGYRAEFARTASLESVWGDKRLWFRKSQLEKLREVYHV